MTNTANVPESTVLEIKTKLAELETSLLESLPNMPVILRDIHKQLKADPNVVTILSDDDCALIVNGLKQQTQTEIVAAAVKSKPKKSLKSMGVDDL